MLYLTQSRRSLAISRSGGVSRWARMALSGISTFLDAVSAALRSDLQIGSYDPDTSERLEINTFSRRRRRRGHSTCESVPTFAARARALRSSFRQRTQLPATLVNSIPGCVRRLCAMGSNGTRVEFYQKDSLMLELKCISRIEVVKLGVYVVNGPCQFAFSSKRRSTGVALAFDLPSNTNRDRDAKATKKSIEMKSSSSLQMGAESKLKMSSLRTGNRSTKITSDSTPIFKLELDFISMNFVVALASLWRIVLPGKMNATPVLLLFEEKAN